MKIIRNEQFIPDFLFLACIYGKDMTMQKWSRANYMPNKPLYEGKDHVTSGQDHLSLSKEAAAEGMVLLKNEDDLLPFRPGQKLAVFGKGLFDYVKGGGGSGDVSVAYVHNLYDGFRLMENGPLLYQPLADFYREYVDRRYKEGDLPGIMREAVLPEELAKGASAYTDTALFVLSRFSGEGWDRRSVYYEGQEVWEADQSKRSQKIFGDSDYYLTEEEKSLLLLVKKYFPRIAVVLNVGGVVDTSWFADDPAISSVLLAWQGGMEGGVAAAELLMGLENPSGKLPDTFALDLEDYPSTAGFHASVDHVDYVEDIYMGYRYFETIRGMRERVAYPFGYGLSYTRFSVKTLLASRIDRSIYFMIKVKNTGTRAGKEVIQVYMKAPKGKLGKPERILVSFEKTKKLMPEEEELISVEVPFYTMASYDDLGKISPSSYILEKGEYCFYVGNSVRGCGLSPKEADYSFLLEEDLILEKLSPRCSPKNLSSRLLADGTLESLPRKETEKNGPDPLGLPPELRDGVTPILRGQDHIFRQEEDPGIRNLMDVWEGKTDLKSFMDQLTDQEMADLLGGQPNRGVANTFGFGNNPSYGIPSLMTTDGPAGVRILPEYEIYTTAWPCSSLLASTWDRKLLYQVGRMAGEEVRENNLSVWLAPAVNLHRNPLCGRNFEYYSEDPLLTGELAAALIRGVQSLKVAATVKHFACNNKETNRRESDSRLSERALREIYLKQFEIIIKKADPWVVMSSYNLINGVRASENKELLEDILRGEWDYDGIVCTDWYTHGEHYRELLAGNDIKMGTGYPDRLMLALNKGLIGRKDMERSVARLLRMIMKVD